ncbi:MAG TPA: beta-ketoacyl synthase N-terminal-like domain-containing protein, partial [Actinocrinis sp.]|nr:beta-ketoacyl synthase N-terminal-like domain-containing protein [Actinocrinis sp.]
FNLVREVVLGSRLDPRTAAFDLQQACATGMEAVAVAANKIALGQIDCAIAGRVDTVSDAPIGLNDALRRLLLKTERAGSPARRAGTLLTGLRPRQVVPDLPRNAEPRTGLSMGEHAARTAAQWGIGRAEQDEVAAASHQRLHAAYESGFFDDLVTPYLGLARDQNLRPDSTAQKLARLRPVFGTGDPATATMTAGNSTPLSDGAALVLLASALDTSGGADGHMHVDSAAPLPREVLAEVARAVGAANASVSRPESIRRARVVEGDFTGERGLLTPSLKTKREAVMRAYRADVEALYPAR